jgi:protein-disulfide isomerase
MKKSKKKKVVLGILLAIFLMGGSFAGFSLLGQSNPNTAKESQDSVKILDLLTNPVTQNASAIGDKRANITLIEFGDYQCQYCAKFHREIRGQLINNYVASGEVKFLFKDFVINDKPGDKSSTLAAVGSYCAAEQGKYWDYHDELYSNSKGENTPWITKETLKKFAVNIKIPDIVKFSNCLESQRYSNLVMQNDNFAKSIGLTSTPSFILVTPGKQPLAIIGAQPYSVFEQAIRQIKS